MNNIPKKLYNYEKISLQRAASFPSIFATLSWIDQEINAVERR